MFRREQMILRVSQPPFSNFCFPATTLVPQIIQRWTNRNKIIQFWAVTYRDKLVCPTFIHDYESSSVQTILDRRHRCQCVWNCYSLNCLFLSSSLQTHICWDQFQGYGRVLASIWVTRKLLISTIFTAFNFIVFYLFIMFTHAREKIR